MGKKGKKKGKKGKKKGPNAEEIVEFFATARAHEDAGEFDDAIKLLRVVCDGYKELIPPPEPPNPLQPQDRPKIVEPELAVPYMEALCRLAKTLRVKGDPKAAILLAEEAVRMSIRAQLSSESPFFELGCAYQRQGDLVNSIKCLRQAVQMGSSFGTDKSVAMARLYLGASYLQVRHGVRPSHYVSHV
jgi:tetratricopeptide (TPR) repeat protein